MRRLVAVIFLGGGLLLGLAGLYMLVSHRESGAAPVSAAEIYNEAVARVAPPVLPPKPAGAVALPPQVVQLHVDGAAPLLHKVPQIAVTDKPTASWQAGVDAQQAAYQQQVQAEIDKIAAAQAQAAPSGGGFITAVLIPLLATLTGFLTAIVGLINALRPARGTAGAKG